MIRRKGKFWGGSEKQPALELRWRQVADWRFLCVLYMFANFCLTRAILSVIWLLSTVFWEYWPLVLWVAVMLVHRRVEWILNSAYSLLHLIHHKCHWICLWSRLVAIIRNGLNMFTCMCVVANISSTEVDVWRDNWVARITVGPWALFSRCLVLGRASLCRLHWTKVAGQATVACDWLRPSAVLSAGAEGKSGDFANSFLITLVITGVVLQEEVGHA